MQFCYRNRLVSSNSLEIFPDITAWGTPYPFLLPLPVPQYHKTSASLRVCLRPCTCNQNFYEYLIKTNECIFHGDRFVAMARHGTEGRVRDEVPSSTSTASFIWSCRGAVGWLSRRQLRSRWNQVERNSEEFGEPESAHTSAGGCRRRSVWLFVLPKQMNNSPAQAKIHPNDLTVRSSDCLSVCLSNTTWLLYTASSSSTSLCCCCLACSLSPLWAQFRLSAPRYGLLAGKACLSESRR